MKYHQIWSEQIIKGKRYILILQKKLGENIFDLKEMKYEEIVL